MRPTIDSDGNQLDDRTAVLDDHLVLVAAAQAARHAVKAIEDRLGARLADLCGYGQRRHARGPCLVAPKACPALIEIPRLPTPDGGL